MPKLLWECPSCGGTKRSDPLAGDDWGGVEIAVGPDCQECGDAMELLDGSEAAEKEKCE